MMIVRLQFFPQIGPISLDILIGTYGAEGWGS